MWTISAMVFSCCDFNNQRFGAVIYLIKDAFYCFSAHIFWSTQQFHRRRGSLYKLCKFTFLIDTICMLILIKIIMNNKVPVVAN